ncbi:MAG TPA: hypothetical protein ENJ80_04410 [Gammaproteobacteria bacterium]|nr:hypothetical protein [Gammaproteobacteria bacterium]
MSIRNTRGFSLIEALLTVLVLSIGLLGLGQLQARLWVASGQLHAQNTAYQLGSNRLEMAAAALLITPDLIPDPPLQVPGIGTLYDTRLLITADGQLSKAQIRITWSVPSGSESVTLATAMERMARTSDTRLLLPVD